MDGDPRKIEVVEIIALESRADMYVYLLTATRLGRLPVLLQDRELGGEYRLILFLLAVGSTTAQAETASQGGLVDCGGRIKAATVQRYFSDLQEALTKSAPKTRFNAFVDTPFGVRSRPGHTLYFNVKYVGSVTPGRIRVQEWQ